MQGGAAVLVHSMPVEAPSRQQQLSRMVVVRESCGHGGRSGGLLQAHPGRPCRDGLTGGRQPTHGRVVQGRPAAGIHCPRPEPSLHQATTELLRLHCRKEHAYIAVIL